MFTEITKYTLVEIEILEFFALYSTKVALKKESRRYVIDLATGYKEMSKSLSLVENW